MTKEDDLAGVRLGIKKAQEANSVRPMSELERIFEEDRKQKTRDIALFAKTGVVGLFRTISESGLVKWNDSTPAEVNVREKSVSLVFNHRQNKGMYTDSESYILVSVEDGWLFIGGSKDLGRIIGIKDDFNSGQFWWKRLSSQSKYGEIIGDDVRLTMAEAVGWAISDPSSSGGDYTGRE